MILNTAINSENEFKSLQEHLQSIELTIQDFEQATGNTDGGKSANIYKQLQQRFDHLSSNYSDFLRRCTQISDQCERYLLTYNEVQHLNEQILQSMNEFDQNVTSPDQQQQQQVKQLLPIFFQSIILHSRTTINYKFFSSMFNLN